MRKLGRFLRPDKRIVKAHLTEVQASRVLNEEGLKRWKNGRVLTPSDYHDNVYMAASLGQQGIIAVATLLALTIIGRNRHA